MTDDALAPPLLFTDWSTCRQKATELYEGLHLACLAHNVYVIEWELVQESQPSYPVR